MERLHTPVLGETAHRSSRMWCLRRAKRNNNNSSSRSNNNNNSSSNNNSKREKKTYILSSWCIEPGKTKLKSNGAFAYARPWGDGT
eukprot:jgi/Botrbrau1/18636/Bobra.0367s0072.1